MSALGIRVEWVNGGLSTLSHVKIRWNIMEGNGQLPAMDIMQI